MFDDEGIDRDYTGGTKVGFPEEEIDLIEPEGINIIERGKVDLPQTGTITKNDGFLAPMFIVQRFKASLLSPRLK